MTVLFWDTEITGFFNEREPVDHHSQPHIVQLAAQLCEDDGSILAGFSFIVDPGVEIPEGAAKVHGITTAKAVKFGLSTEFALNAFTHLYQRADSACAHNVKFDKGVTEAAIARHYKRILPLRKTLFCTMEAASPIINLPPTERMKAAGFNKPKPPKLEECIKHFFGEPLDGAHDAMVDVIACRRVFFHLKSIGAWPAEAAANA